MKLNDMLEDIAHIMKNAVLLAPRMFDKIEELKKIESDIDIFHLQDIGNFEYIFDKTEELCAKYRNVYILAETHPLMSCIAGMLAKPNWLESTNFECNVYYLVWDNKNSLFLPYKLNEDLA